MRATPVLAVVAAVLAAGCGSNSSGTRPDLGPLADQADRVAQLIDEQRPCEAVEAARTLVSLADDEPLGDQVSQAIRSFATSAQSSIACPVPPSEPASDPPRPGADGQDAGGDDAGGSQDGDDGTGDDSDERGRDDDKGDDKDGHPGEGKAKGRNGNPGRGNSDD